MKTVPQEISEIRGMIQKTILKTLRFCSTFLSKAAVRKMQSQCVAKRMTGTRVKRSIGLIMPSGSPFQPQWEMIFSGRNLLPSNPNRVGSNVTIDDAISVFYFS